MTEVSYGKADVEGLAEQYGEKNPFLPALARFFRRCEAQHYEMRFTRLRDVALAVGPYHTFLRVDDSREGVALETVRMFAELIAGGREAVFRVRPSVDTMARFRDGPDGRDFAGVMSYGARVRFSVWARAGAWSDTPEGGGDRWTCVGIARDLARARDALGDEVIVSTMEKIGDA